LAKKFKLFLLNFSAAYLLANILLSVFNLPAFNLAEPSLSALLFDVGFRLLAWGVSVIVYVTLRDGIQEHRKKKKEEEDSFEIS